MAWKARLFMGLMLTLMILAIAGPALADDNNNRQERREDRREDRREFREEFREDFFGFNHDIDSDDCCDDELELDEEVVFLSDFDFLVPLVYVVEIDVDCDGINDKWDWWIGNGCVIEDVDIEPLFD